jgi:hypothetical protein
MVSHWEYNSNRHGINILTCVAFIFKHVRMPAVYGVQGGSGVVTLGVVAGSYDLP